MTHQALNFPADFQLPLRPVSILPLLQHVCIVCGGHCSDSCIDDGLRCHSCFVYFPGSLIEIANSQLFSITQEAEALSFKYDLLVDQAYLLFKVIYSRSLEFQDNLRLLDLYIRSSVRLSRRREYLIYYQKLSKGDVSPAPSRRSPLVVGEGVL